MPREDITVIRDQLCQKERQSWGKLEGQKKVILSSGLYGVCVLVHAKGFFTQNCTKTNETESK